MSEVDQLDDAGRAAIPITNDQASPPQCDRDKLVCPHAQWMLDRRKSDAKVIAALKEAIEVAVERFEGCGMKYAAEEIRKLRAASIEQDVGESK